MRLLMYAFLIISTCIKFCVEAYKPFLHLLSSKLGNKDILIHANSLLGIVHSVNKILFRPNEIDKTLISVSMVILNHYFYNYTIIYYYMKFINIDGK